MNKELTIQEIQSKIINLPGRPPAMLDRDLAVIYETETRTINQAVKRNIKRFPNDFRFQLTKEDIKILRSQSVIFDWLQTVKYLPYAFTREGANMLSAVLHTEIAIDRSIHIMRAFSTMEAFLNQPPDSLSPAEITGRDFDISAKRFILALEVAKASGINNEHEARETANRITKLTTGVDLLEFIRPGYDPASQKCLQEEDESLLMFVNIWWQKYGEEPVDSHYLRQMIIDADIPLDLGTGSPRSQKTRLSRMLGKIKDQRTGSFHITQAGTYRNSKLWKLKCSD